MACGPSHITKARNAGSGLGRHTIRRMAMRKRFIVPLILSALVATLSGEAAAQQTIQSRAVRPAAVSGELLDIANANDGRVDTRATSGRADYVGMSFMVDLGG